MVDYMLFTEVMALRQEVERIRDQRDKALQERDEARRMYCSVVESSARQYGTAAQSVATQLCWDCFKKEETT